MADAFDAVAVRQWNRPGLRSNGSRFTVETLGPYLVHDLVHHVWDLENPPSPGPRRSDGTSARRRMPYDDQRSAVATVLLAARRTASSIMRPFSSSHAPVVEASAVASSARA